MSRGIDNNRFFLTGFGGEFGDLDAVVDNPRNTDAPRTVDLDSNPQACTMKRWGTAQEFATSILVTDSLQSNSVLGGSEEGGWWGIYMAAEGEIGVRTGTRAFSPVCAGESADTDGFVNTPYKFRKNAAVHFVLISDEPGTVSLRTPNGPFVRNLNEMLSVLSMASLTDTNNAPNKISNAVVTAIVPALFTDIKNTNIAGNPAIADPIMGIDADVFDNWDVDRNQASSTNHQAHVFVHKPATNKVNVITTSADILDFYGQDVDNNNAIVTKPANYQSDLLNRLLADPSVPYLGEIDAVPIQHIAQRRFFSERYAFLAWETGGTVWDIDFAIGKVRRGVSGTGSVWLPDEIRQQDDPLLDVWYGSIFQNQRMGDRNSDGKIDEEVPIFKAAVVDDIFEKIRMQLGDLNADGRMTLNGDIPAFFDSAKLVMTNPGNHGVNLDKFDLNGNGLFFDASTGKVDEQDIIRLVKILATEVGDSNFDYQFTPQLHKNSYVSTAFFDRLRGFS